MEEFEKGQILSIRFKISAIRDATVSCIIKWVEHDRIGLDFPERKTDLSKYLCEEKELEAVVYTDQGIYVFDSIVIDSPYSTDFVIELPDETTKLQRREFVRVPIRLDLTLAKDHEKIKAQTINVGGGGIRFVINRELKIGDLWYFEMPLPKGLSTASGSGNILYTIKQDSKMISVIKFKNVEEIHRNKIIKMCFEEEASRLKIKNSIDKK